MRQRLKDFWWWLCYFVRTRGTTERWLRRVWTELIDRDIHPDEDVEMIAPNGKTLHVSAFGSQLWVRWPAEGYQFIINYSDFSGLYVHEKFGNSGGDGDWALAYKERGPRQLLRSRWVSSMKLLAANLSSIEDRSAQNTVDYRGVL